MTTDANGRIDGSLTASDPGHPRGYIDGQVYCVTYGMGTLPPPPGSVVNTANLLNAVVRSGLDEPAAPTWLRDIEPIFTQYANLYPVMRPIVDMADYADVVRVRSLLIEAFERPIEDPAYMPVTRDLSRAKRDMIRRWPPTTRYMALDSLDDLQRAGWWPNLFTGGAFAGALPGENRFTIGWFYEQLDRSLVDLHAADKITFGHAERQVTRWPVPGALRPITDLAGAQAALAEIRHQGEGSGPRHPGDGARDGELGHYFRFAQIVHGRRLVVKAHGFDYSGEVIPFDEDGVWPMDRPGYSYLPESSASSTRCSASSTAASNQSDCPRSHASSNAWSVSTP